MAFTTGTATDYIDLADKLRLWLTGTAGWTQEQWTPGNVTTGGMVLNLRGPGAAADKRVFINIRSSFDDTVPAYSWEIRGAIAYSGAAVWGSQTGESAPCYLGLWKSTISYWFYANDRRFIIVAKCNTVYVSAYCGFMLPWATPAQYPFPLFVAASDGILRAYNSTNSAHRMFCDPGGALLDSGGDYNAAKLRKQDGSWVKVRNQQVGAPNDFPWNNTNSDPFVYPYSLRGGGATVDAKKWTGTSSASGGTVDSGAVDNLVATAQSERLLMPVAIMNTIEPAGFGALDGVYFPMGQGLTPEQTATFSARTFRAFNNVHRSSGNDFFMVEEV